MPKEIIKKLKQLERSIDQEGTLEDLLVCYAILTDTKEAINKALKRIVAIFVKSEGGKLLSKDEYNTLMKSISNTEEMEKYCNELEEVLEKAFLLLESDR